MRTILSLQHLRTSGSFSRKMVTTILLSQHWCIKDLQLAASNHWYKNAHEHDRAICNQSNAPHTKDRHFRSSQSPGGIYRKRSARFTDSGHSNMISSNPKCEQSLVSRLVSLEGTFLSQPQGRPTRRSLGRLVVGAAIRPLAKASHTTRRQWMRSSPTHVADHASVDIQSNELPATSKQWLVNYLIVIRDSDPNKTDEFDLSGDKGPVIVRREF